MALEAARAFKPDLVITDIQLPHVTGLELMELIRADEELCDVPIMAVTAYSGVGDDERIRAAGAQAYVSKPISVVRFAETVEELLEDGPIGSNEKAAPMPEPALKTQMPDAEPGVTPSKRLLDLGFLELDVLARDRVVLAERHLLGLVARVLLGHIEEARVGGADELDLDGCRLGHREKS